MKYVNVDINEYTAKILIATSHVAGCLAIEPKSLKKFDFSLDSAASFSLTAFLEGLSKTKKASIVSTNDITALHITAALIPPTLTANFVNASIIAELMIMLNRPIEVSLKPKIFP